jgi:hypothetical protein
MKTYLVLYMAPNAETDKMMKHSTPEEQKQMDEGWTKWMKAHKKSFVGEGAMLGKNKRVTKDGVQDVRNELTGYDLVKAESAEEAAKIFTDNPMLAMPGAYVEVTECIAMSEMKREPKK